MIAQAATVLPRLLVVEDSPAAAGELCRLFEQHQFDVTHAQSGEEALSRLRESLPDALAIDSRLPDTSGDELCATIRRFQDWAHLPILLVLSADDPDTRVKGLTSGADDCIGRTDNSSELLARLRRLLARAEIHELLTEQEKLVTLRRAATTMAHCINNP
ncbi:MAG: response regulator, partial [Candidatus Wallbacteria bacterium]|nr:response regulator [Candidatus Wallbacteria bacterium]